MMVFAWLSLAKAAQTDCVTKDLTWRWLSTTAEGNAKAGDRWVHGSTVVTEQAPGATGRVTWTADEASKVPFRKTADGETFKWKVALSATDGKAIAAGVPETKLDLTMHCLRTTGAGAPAAAAPAAPAAPAAAKVAPKPAPAPAPAAPPAPK